MVPTLELSLHFDLFQLFRDLEINLVDKKVRYTEWQLHNPGSGYKVPADFGAVIAIFLHNKLLL